MALTDNIQAYYKFDESSGNAADSTANAYTLTNENTVGYAAGLINNGADFGTTNTNKRFTRADALGVTHQNFSWSGWVKIATAPASGESQMLFLIRTNASSNYIDWFISYNNTGGTKNLKFHRNKPGVADVQVTYNVDLGTGTWHHIVMTYDTATLLGYVDGTQQATTSVSGIGTGGASSTAIGGAATDDGSNGYVQGMMDEVGVWTRTITSSEVTELYNSGAGLQYPFAGGGGTIRDARFLTLLGVG